MLPSAFAVISLTVFLESLSGTFEMYRLWILRAAVLRFILFYNSAGFKRTTRKRMYEEKCHSMKNNNLLLIQWCEQRVDGGASPLVKAL
jgi:hypothetical protein